MPGPFRLSGRVGGHRSSDEGGLVITTLAYLTVAVVVLVYGLAWLLVAAATRLWRLGVLLVRRLWSRP